jgi:hypothetical protein
MGISSPLVMLLRGTGNIDDGGRVSDIVNAEYTNARPGGGGLALMIDGKED